MTQPISPVSSKNTAAESSLEESPKSWWETITRFIFAEEQLDEPAAPLQEKKIMEIDPAVLRKQRLAEEAAAAAREREKRLAAEKRAAEKSHPPVAQVAQVELPKFSVSQPGIAVDEKMRAVAQQRLARLAARSVVLNERAAALEQARLLNASQIKDLRGEIDKLSKTGKPQRMRRRERQALDDKIAKYIQQVGVLSEQSKKTSEAAIELKRALEALNKAMVQAQKVADLLKGEWADPKMLEDLEKAAHAAEMALAIA